MAWVIAAVLVAVVLGFVYRHMDATRARRYEEAAEPRPGDAVTPPPRRPPGSRTRGPAAGPARPAPAPAPRATIDGPRGGLDRVAAWLGARTAAAPALTVEEAAGLVREADARKERVADLAPGAYVQALRAEILPRYLRAIRGLEASLAEASHPDDERRKAREDRAGYLYDVGLAIGRAVLTFRRQNRTPSASIRREAVALRDLTVAVLQDVPDDFEDAGAAYNLGSFEEMAGDVVAAEAAYRRALALDPDGRFGGLARDSLAELAAGRPLRWP